MMLVQEPYKEASVGNITRLPMADRRTLCQSCVLLSVMSTSFLGIAKRILWGSQDIVGWQQSQDIGCRL